MVLPDRSSSEIPRLVLPDELFVNIAVTLSAEINRFLGFLQYVASGRNLKQFLMVCSNDGTFCWYPLIASIMLAFSWCLHCEKLFCETNHSFLGNQTKNASLAKVMNHISIQTREKRHSDIII